MAAEQVQGWQPRSIALVDIAYLWKVCWHGQPRDAAPGAAAQATLDRLSAVRESVEHVVVCVDSPPYRRAAIDPTYKAQREKPADEELAQKRWLMDRIEKDGYQVAKAKGYEADDVIATLANAYAWCQDVRIIASDKDMAQCVTETCRMYVPGVGQRPGEIRGPAEISAKYGVDPQDMGLWLALVGDGSDNIKGVPGIGPKKAAELIGNCVNLVGIAEALATTADDEKPGAMWKALAANWEQLQQAVQLTRLERDVPVDAVALLGRREAQKLVEDEMAEDMGEETEAAGTSVAEAEFDPISRAPEGYVAPAMKAPSEPPKALAIVKDEYGMVTADLQPCDLKSAKYLAKLFYNGRLYPKFATPEALFTIMVKGRELGLNVTTALDGFHLIEGKPSASADLIRALAMRHPDCEYFRLVESTPEKATWETKNRRNPEPTRYTYTIEEARQAGLRGGNWGKRDRQMLAKTCSSILARIEYPGATQGLYCDDELGAA